MPDPAIANLIGERRAAQVTNVRVRSSALERNRAGVNVVTGGGGAVADATPTVKGKVKLAELFDPTSTADLPKLRRGTSTDAGAVGHFDIRDFGGVEGGDILAALNAAQTAMPSYGGVLLIPLNRVNLSDLWTMTKPIRVFGNGLTQDIFAQLDANWHSTTQIKWTKGTSGTMFKVGAASYSFATTDVDATANTITKTAHGFHAGAPVWFGNNGGTLPGGLSASTSYFVVNPTANTFQVSATLGGAAVDITSQGTGTHNVLRMLNGFGLDGFVLHGGGLATVGFDFPCAQGGTIGTIGVRNMGTGGIAYDMHTDAAIPGSIVDNTQVINAKLLLGAAPTILRCRGSEPASGGVLANSCHIVIDQIAGQFGVDGSAVNGIDLQESDNITFGQALLSRFGTGTGFAVRFGPRARAHVFLHLQPGGGVSVEAPAVAGQSNRIVHYDRENSQPSPSIATGATLTWTETGRLSTGNYVNSKAVTPVHTNHWSARVGGDTGVEIVAQDRAATSGSAYLEARAKDAAGADLVASIRAFNVAHFGTQTAHDVYFERGSVESFRLDSSGHIQVASGKRIHLPAGTTSADGVRVGADALPIALYRDAPNSLRLDNAALVLGGKFTAVDGVAAYNSTNAISRWAPFRVINGSQGGDVAAVAGEITYTEVFIGCNCRLTGIIYNKGGTVDTAGFVIVGLHDSSGSLLRSSTLAGTAISAGANAFQTVPFTSVLDVFGPGRYYISVQFDVATTNYRAIPQTAMSPATGSQAGTFGTMGAITSPSTTYTSNKGVIASTY